jgi:photosystem II stability/assembly factor-like uncharacterized protein
MMMKHLQMATLAGAASLALTLTACTATGSGTPTGGDVPRVEHIHALALEQETDDVLIGTHGGIFRFPTDGGAIEGPIGDNVFDAMGLLAGAASLYASGHPGPEGNEGMTAPNVGLITSTDDAMTWSNIALAGTTDFHELAVDATSTPPVLYGLPSGESVVMRSDDGGSSWTTGAALEARDLEVSDGVVYATTADGLQVSDDRGETFSVDETAPALFYVTRDPATDGALVGINTDGAVWSRPGATAGWTRTGEVESMPVAVIARLNAGTTGLIVADEERLSESSDGGRTWTTLVTWN